MMTLRHQLERFAHLVETCPDETRHAVYRRNHRHTRRRALALIFPTCLRIVGQECFDAVATRYITMNPCHSASLEDEGAEFWETWSDIVESHPAGFEGLEYLPDLAHLEHHRQRAWLTPALERRDWAVYTDLEPLELQEMRPLLDPTLQLLRTPWALLSVLDVPQEVEVTGALWTRCVEGRVQHGSLSVDLVAVIERVSRGATLRDLEAQGTASQILNQAVESGFFLGLEPGQ